MADLQSRNKAYADKVHYLKTKMREHEYKWNAKVKQSKMQAKEASSGLVTARQEVVNREQWFAVAQ